MWFVQIKQLNPFPLFPLSVFLPRKLCFSYPVSEEKANLNSLFPCYTRSLFLPSCSVKADLCHSLFPQLQDGWLQPPGRRCELGNTPPRVCTECPRQLYSGAEQWSSRGLDRDVPSPSTHKTSRDGAWLNCHYVFMMPFASYCNHRSCLSFSKYPGKWSNNQMTSLTE